MHKEIFAIAKQYGDDCKNCKEICCANMALTINRKEVQQMAKKLDMDKSEFRKKYTVLLNSFFKDGEVKMVSKEAKSQLKGNPRVLKFDEVKPEELPMTEKQKERLKGFSKGKEFNMMVCPFFEKKTQLCKIHDARPSACRVYPFNYAEKNQIDLRKINACELSKNCLKRIIGFLDKIGKNAKYPKKVIDSGEYHNHFYVPALLVYSYVLWECEKLNIPVTSPELKKMKKAIIMDMLK